jgi:hypothetical protein
MTVVPSGSRAMSRSNASFLRRKTSASLPITRSTRARRSTISGYTDPNGFHHRLHQMHELRPGDPQPIRVPEHAHEHLPQDRAAAFLAIGKNPVRHEENHGPDVIGNDIEGWVMRDRGGG